MVHNLTDSTKNVMSCRHISIQPIVNKKSTLGLAHHFSIIFDFNVRILYDHSVRIDIGKA